LLKITHPRARVLAGAKRRRRGGFFPTQVSAVSAWLRLAASTPVGGEYTVIVDVLNSNPTVQAGSARWPAAATSANGLPVATWDGTDVLTWPLAASNSATQKWGLQLWFKPPANISTRQRILHIGFADAFPKVQVDVVNNGISVQWSRDGTNGRQWTITSGVTASVWQCLRLAFDGTQATDATIMRHFINEVDLTASGSFVDVGTGGAMTSLSNPGGLILLGGGSNSDTPAVPLLAGFQTGPNWLIMNNTITTAQGAALMAFEAPT
jgi:hypothetical protein